MKTKYDTLLVSRPENIHYLSGFTGEGVLLLKKDKKMLITDARYVLRAKEEKQRGVQVMVVDKSFIETLTVALKTLRTKKLGFESSHLTVARLTAFKKRMRQLKLKFIPTESEIEKKREVKTAAEIQKIRKSCQITVRVLRGVLKFLKIGKIELEVAEEIRRLAIWLGAEELAFDPVVAFGANSACPHAKPSRRKLRKGDVVLLDLGAKYAGYCSDMTRTFFTAPPTERQREVYEAVLAAQKTGVQKIRPGVKACKVDGAVRGVLQQAGYEKQFTHSTGHGVGLEIHESPSLNKIETSDLQAGNVVTVEPGVYLEKNFGVRIEDTVVVTKTGAKILTEFPKDLTVLKV